MQVTFRPASPVDADQAVPRICSSAPPAFDFIIAVPGVATASEFLRRAFLDGGGEFAFRNHVVGELDGAATNARAQGLLELSWAAR
jgi:hypothetical protein